MIEDALEGRALTTRKRTGEWRPATCESEGRVNCRDECDDYGGDAGKWDGQMVRGEKK